MAIVDSMALYALGYAAHESHPMRMDKYCLNTIQLKYPCSNCSDACPQSIKLDGKEINWKGCTNCNLCVTACPTQAIHESSATLDASLSSAENAGDVVVVACDKYEGQTNIRGYCLGSIPWELIVAISLKKPVVLKVKPCQNCEHAELRDCVRDLVSNLKRFFGPEEFKKRIHSRVPEGALAGEGAAKRTALMGAVSTVKRGAEELLADVPQEKRASHYRAILLDALSSMPEEERPQVMWLTLTEDGNCRGCVICSRMCPHGAISLRIPELAAAEAEREAKRKKKSASFSAASATGSASTSAAFTFGSIGADPSGVSDAAASAESAEDETAATSAEPQTQAHIHDASRCTQCGLCYMSCPVHNIGGWDELTTNKVPAKVEHPIEVILCEKCGQPFKQKGAETKCAACSRYSLRQPGQ